MLKNFSIEAPLCESSIGQMAMGCLFEMFQRGLNPCIFPIGPISLSYFHTTPEFNAWLENNIRRANREFSKKDPSITIFHISNSARRLGEKSRIWTPHEASMATETELNILSQFDDVAFTSDYSRDIFNEAGLKSRTIPNYFDSRHIFPTPVFNYRQEVTRWNITGKYERRKLITPTVAAWIKKFGGNSAHRLTLQIDNPFIFQNVESKNRVEAHKQLLESHLGQKLPFNIFLLPALGPMEFNQSQNAVDIFIGTGGAEGWGLPLFQSLCLGKKAIALNEHGHKMFCNEENSVLLKSNGRASLIDNHFFVQGDFNQGELFTFDPQELDKAFDEVLARPAPDPQIAKALREKFSVRNTVNLLLEDF